MSLDPSEDGVWIIPPFRPEPPKVPGGEETAGVAVGAGEPGGAGAVTPTEETSRTATAVDSGAKGTVRRFLVRGDVPVENWGELFRCFVGPALLLLLAAHEQVALAQRLRDCAHAAES